MALILPNSRDVGNKFLFGHFMMRPDYGSGRKIEGPGYGRVNFWCSGNYKTKLEHEMDYMEQVGCNGYMIELCARSAGNEPLRWNHEPYGNDWLKELEEKYNGFLELIKKHKKMWALVSIFNGHAWERKVGPDSGTISKILDIVKKAGHKDMICILPVGEPGEDAGSIIRSVHEKLNGFKILKSAAADNSTDYWNWYSSGYWQAPNKKLFESSDSGEEIANLAGYEAYSWVPKFPPLTEKKEERRIRGESGNNEEEEEKVEIATYDYRGNPERTVQWARRRTNEDRPLSLIYYAWGYDGNHDGAKKGDGFGDGKVDAYAICGTVVGCNKGIPAGQMMSKVNEMVGRYGIPSL